MDCLLQSLQLPCKMFSSCLYTETELEQRRIHRAIEKELRQQRKLERRSVKLLLLGAGESGKSTFLKQMRIIHGEGYSERDRTEFRTVVHGNVVSAMQTLIGATEKLGMMETASSMEEEKRAVMSATVPPPSSASFSGLANALRSLWADEGVRRCYDLRSRFQLSDSVEYFMQDLDRIAAEGYVPTEQDVLRVRTPSTGVVEYSFEYPKSGMLFRFMDVGGQRCERRKWIHCFESVTAVIFLAALSEFDQTLAESPTENRMVESKLLFKIIAESKWFEESAIILFLNKTDLLEEKITRSSSSNLSDHFPDFGGPRGDAESAKNFIADMFLHQLCEKRLAEKMYSFFTCATDTDNIRKVFKVVKDSILVDNLVALQLYSMESRGEEEDSSSPAKLRSMPDLADKRLY